MRTILDEGDRAGLLRRFRSLRPDTPPRWGRMSASQMLTHLSDQLRHALGDASAAAQPGPLWWPGIKQIVMYWLPWPRGRVNGPPEAFLTQPTEWAGDLATFEALLARFVAQRERTEWPGHALFGPMTRTSWGRFSHRHFDYHLKQFGA